MDDFRVSVRAYLPGGNTFRMEMEGPWRRILAGFLHQNYRIMRIPRSGVWYHIAVQFKCVSTRF